ncbi:MAG: TadE/TadG family type IV pilus assembly protein [Bryobacteraceae bacterium]
MPSSEGCVKIRSAGKRISAGNKRGQAVAEFALVLPLLMMVVTGQLAFGLAIHNYLVLTNAVNTGTQVLAISRGQTADPCATASGAIDNAAFGLTTGSLSFSYVINGTSYSGTTCTAAAANMVQGASARVSATYPCTLTIFLMTFPSCTLGAQTTEIIQ